MTVYSIGPTPPGLEGHRRSAGPNGKFATLVFSGGRIAPNRYADFTVLGTPFESGQAVWPVVQAYSDGKDKPWTGPPEKPGEECPETGPDRPGPAAAQTILEPGQAPPTAPRAAGGGSGDDDSDTAIWLGVIAIGISGARGPGHRVPLVHPAGDAARRTTRRTSDVSTLRRTRLDPATFALPVEKMRDGYYSDAYFTFTRDVLEHDGHHPDVLMQVFQRERSVLGGIDEALAILRLCSGRRLPDGGWEDGWDRLEVRALHDGDEIEPWETV